jgi:glycosyltransferase involved in cell wall biosynthesis
MQMARPVVATKAGGLPESIMDGETGFLFEMENVDQMTDRLRILLDDYELAAEMGRKGRERVKEFFSLERFIGEYDKVYRRIISKNE